MKVPNKFVGIVFLALAGAGIWVDFVPSYKFRNVGLFFSLILVIGYFLVLKSSGSYKFAPNINKTLQVILAVSFCYVTCFVATVHGIAGYANKAYGKIELLEAKLVKTVSRSKRECDFKLSGSMLFGAYPEHYCITEQIYDLLPKYGIYEVKVYKSKLGITITHIDFDSVRVH